VDSQAFCWPLGSIAHDPCQTYVSLYLGLFAQALTTAIAVYSNSLLGTLNARSRLRTKLQASRTGSSGREGVTIALASRSGNNQLHEIPELSSTGKVGDRLMTFAVRKDVVVESV
jgi:hypothetical protein